MCNKKIRVRYLDGSDVTFYDVSNVSYYYPGFVDITEMGDYWSKKIFVEYRIPLSNIQFIVDETED
jgi:hypothetical protein